MYTLLTFVFCNNPCLTVCYIDTYTYTYRNYICTYIYLYIQPPLQYIGPTFLSISPLTMWVLSSFASVFPSPSVPICVGVYSQPYS